MNFEHARAQAETALKKKQQARTDAEAAMAEYRADQQATREKTARLRALRLRRDQTGKKTALPGHTTE